MVELYFPGVLFLGFDFLLTAFEIFPGALIQNVLLRCIFQSFIEYFKKFMEN